MASESGDDGVAEPPKKVAAGRFGKCEVCKDVEAKYRCPGCGLVFCSVACSRKHKEESGCTGKRDRTAFVALGEITDTVLASDYVLLEDSQRRKDAGYRTLNNISSAKHPPAALFVNHLINTFKSFPEMVFHASNGDFCLYVFAGSW